MAHGVQTAMHFRFFSWTEVLVVGIEHLVLEIFAYSGVKLGSSMLTTNRFLLGHFGVSSG